MNSEQSVKITPFEALGKDDRGTTTEIVIDRSGKALSIFRKKDTIFGNHYHTGKETAKNPEIFWLLHGELKFEYKHINEEDWNSITATGATKIEVYPNILHRVTALTDSYMLELNSLQEHIDDTERCV